MKEFKYVYLMLGLATATLTSCGDVDDEILTNTFDRNFSPLNLESKNVGEEDAEIQWQKVEGATSYMLEIYADDSLTFEGDPVRNLETDLTKVKLDGLVYDTKYSIRVKALTEGHENLTSKWSKLFFRTNAQQIFSSIKEENAFWINHTQIKYEKMSSSIGSNIAEAVAEVMLQPTIAHTSGGGGGGNDRGWNDEDKEKNKKKRNGGMRR